MSPSLSSNKNALILLSGGLDSATCLAIAQQQDFSCHTLSFDYGQRHRAELLAAQRLATASNVKSHKIFRINLDEFGGSALTDSSIDVPTNGLTPGIPVTYVPARNTIFLSLALAWAEVLGVRDIFLGVNALDYSGYPDCRPEYIAAFQAMARLATKEGVSGLGVTIHTPLIHWTKAEIIRAGSALQVDYRLTVSCYQADDQGRACGQCDSCRLRQKGFLEAGIPDPTCYTD